MDWRLTAALAAAVAVTAAGCGSSGDPGEPALGATPVAKRTLRVAALGDSITAGSPLWDPDPEVRRNEISDPRRASQYEYWVQRRLPRVRFRNCGVFGERTDQIAKRLRRCARGARVLIVQGGINDIAQERPIARAARDLRTMVLRGRSLGLWVALVEVLPWNNGPPGADGRIRALNRKIRALGAERKVPVYHWYRRLEDPSIPGQMHPQWTIDGDHPSVEGYRRLADTVRLP